MCEYWATKTSSKNTLIRIISGIDPAMQCLAFSPHCGEDVSGSALPILKSTRRQRLLQLDSYRLYAGHNDIRSAPFLKANGVQLISF